MKLINFLFVLILSSFLIGCFSQYLQPIVVDDFVVSGSIFTQGASGAADETNSGNTTDIIGGVRNLFTRLIGNGAATELSTMLVNTPTSSSNYGTLTLTTTNTNLAFGEVYYDAAPGSGNACGKPSDQLSDSGCSAGGCVNPPGLTLDASSKDGIGFLVQGLNVAGAVNFLTSIWTGSALPQSYGYSSYVYPNLVTDPGTSLPFLFFPFSHFTQLSGNSLVLSEIAGIAVEMNTTVPSLVVTIGPPQLIGTYVFKTSSLSNQLNPGSSLTIGPGTNVQFSLYFLPDIVQIRPAQSNVNQVTYTVSVTDTLPSFFSNFSSSPFTLSQYTLTNNLITSDPVQLLTGVNSLTDSPLTPITNTGSGNVASATFTVPNPQGVTLEYSVTSASTYPFCSQQLCNQAQFAITTQGVTGNVSTTTKTASYCFVLQSTPVISTTFTTCPTAFSNTPNTVTQVCNNGNGLATDVAFAQSTFAGCTVSSVTNSLNAAITCNGGMCTGNLGNISANSCVNIQVNYNCNSMQSSCTPVSFVSAASSTENCVGSSNGTTCSFTVSPGMPILAATYTTCPATYVTNPTLTSQVCNTGNGVAQNTLFNETALAGCSVISISNPNITCNNGLCIGNLGNLNPGSCSSVSIFYNCSVDQFSCKSLSLSSQLIATETCLGVSSNVPSCSFSLNPGSAVLSSTFTSCPSSYSPNPATTSQVCNTGNGIAQNTIFNQTILSGCTVISNSNPSILCNNGYCVGNLGSLTPGSCSAVTIGYDCSTSQGSCNLINFASQLTATESCVGSTSTSPLCSFSLNPGTPVLSASFTTCPTYSTNPTTTAQICNTGTGSAQNTIFNQTVFSGCSVVLVSNNAVTCNGGVCSGNIGSLNAGKCASISINFDCSSIQNLGTSSEISQVSASESCVGAISGTPTCSFSVSVGTPSLSIVFSKCPSNFTTTTTSRVCNKGYKLTTNNLFNVTQLKGCTATNFSNPAISCNGGFCTGNVGSLNVSSCIHVHITYNCEFAYYGAVKYAQKCFHEKLEHREHHKPKKHYESNENNEPKKHYESNVDPNEEHVSNTDTNVYGNRPKVYGKQGEKSNDPKSASLSTKTATGNSNGKNSNAKKPNGNKPSSIKPNGNKPNGGNSNVSNQNNGKHHGKDRPLGEKPHKFNSKETNDESNDDKKLGKQDKPIELDDFFWISKKDQINLN